MVAWTLNQRYLARIRRFLRFVAVGRVVLFSGAALSPPEVDARVAEFRTGSRLHRGSPNVPSVPLAFWFAGMMPTSAPSLLTTTHSAFARSYWMRLEMLPCLSTKMRTALRGYLRFLIARGECKPWLMLCHCRLRALAVVLVATLSGPTRTLSESLQRETDSLHGVRRQRGYFCSLPTWASVAATSSPCVSQRHQVGTGIVAGQGKGVKSQLPPPRMPVMYC